MGQFAGAYMVEEVGEVRVGEWVPLGCHWGMVKGWVVGVIDRCSAGGLAWLVWPGWLNGCRCGAVVVWLSDGVVGVVDRCSMGWAGIVEGLGWLFQREWMLLGHH